MGTAIVVTSGKGGAGKSTVSLGLAAHFAAEGARVLLIDCEKFGRTALLTYAQISDFDAIVTERVPAPEYAKACQDGGTELIIANEDGE